MILFTPLKKSVRISPHQPSNTMDFVEKPFSLRRKTKAFFFAAVQFLCLANVGLGELFTVMCQDHQAVGDAAATMG